MRLLLITNLLFGCASTAALKPAPKISVTPFHQEQIYQRCLAEFTTSELKRTHEMKQYCQCRAILIGKHIIENQTPIDLETSVIIHTTCAVLLYREA